jgi:hypothetical protein
VVVGVGYIRCGLHLAVEAMTTTDQNTSGGTPSNGSPTAPAAAGMKDYSKHAIWIYSVIVGLAFREAIITTFNHSRTATTYHELLEVARFFVFFFVTSTFYLGSAQFFEDVHGPGSDSKYSLKKKRFGLDFMMGMIHFMFFFGWAMALYDHTIWIFGVSPSFLLMLAVFFYDVIWFAISTDLCTRNLIGKWTGLSVLAVVVSILGFGAIRALYEVSKGVFSLVIKPETASTSSEFIALLIVVLFTIYDFRAIIRGDAIFPKWMRKFVSMFQDESLDPAA